MEAGVSVLAPGEPALSLTEGGFEMRIDRSLGNGPGSCLYTQTHRACRFLFPPQNSVR